MKAAYITIGLLALAGGTRAEEDAAVKPLSFGGFDNQGSISTGYRFTDVKGYEPKFLELFDLQNGLRLLDLSLFGRAKTDAATFADNYSFTLTGVGGEPYSTAQFSARKNKLYDLRVNLRQSHYYWNRNDSAQLPSALHSLTSNHDWATVRKLGSVNLLVHASKELQFSFEYYRNTRDGMTFTTRSLDYFGSSSTWGGFARANPYYVEAPLNEASNRVTGGVDYTRREWSLHYRLGYQSFDQAVKGTNVTTPQRSINVDDVNTSRELLTGVSWSDSRQLKTPVSEFSYTGKPINRLEARGGYIFYRYSGPASIDMAFNGLARTATATIVAPYAVSFSTKAQVTEPNHVIDQGFTYKVNDWWNVLLDYRYSRFTVDSVADFHVVNGSTTTAGASENQWQIGTHTVDLNMTFTPAAWLFVRTGVRLLKSDVESLEDGVTDPQRTKRIKSVWPVASVFFQPVKMLTVRADVEEINNGTSYTRVTPHTDIGGRLVLRFKPTEKFYLDDTVIVRNRKLLQTDYRSTIRSNSVLANYDWSNRFSVYAGFSYDSFFATDFVSFLRGTTPFTNLSLRDQTVDRVWQGGIRATLLPRLSISFAGNFVRTTGVGEIYGEAPLYGPMSFPYATGSVHYDFPAVGRLSLQLQRTYYSEQIVSGNNFSANLLTIIWTKSF
jgi:hypothetical protein